MKKHTYISFLFCFALLSAAHAQDKPAYRLFNAKGKEVNYKKVIQAAAESDIFFFGESHNNPIAHWLQVEMTQDLHEAKDGQIVLGAEMFETDDQILLDEYFQGLIRERNFEDEAKLWSNYETDYKPLLLWAKENQIPYLGTNVPRRYAALVYRQGLEGLDEISEQAKALLAPLPIEFDPEVPCYANMLSGEMAHGGSNIKLPQAQALKDATMAWTIAQNLQEDHTFIHLNGSYHSLNKEGIIWYLKRYAPDTQLLTLTTVSQTSIDKLDEEHLNTADYILCIPETMTTTY